jgi:glycosyltransferase involved in cell wall biosynthesis
LTADEFAKPPNRPLRVLHVLLDVRDLGNGIVNAAVDLACAQAADGHEVWVASLGGDFEPLLARHGVTHLPLDQTRTVGKIVCAAARLRRMANRLAVDVVHAHMVTALVLARAVRPFGIRFLIVATVHNEFTRGSQLMALADLVIAVSESNRRSLLARRFPARRVRTVLNGIVGSPRRGGFPPPAQLKRPAVVTVAGLYHRKGLVELVDAVAKLRDCGVAVHLYLVGEGPDRADIEARVDGQGLSPRVHFEGFHPDPRPWLLSSDVFVLFSRREPFALAVTEAREAGCAVVASNVDGVPEALSGGRAGQLVPVGDVTALATVLQQLLTDAEALAAWRAAAGRDLAAYTVARVADDTLRLYREMLSKRRSWLRGRPRQPRHQRPQLGHLEG